MEASCLRCHATPAQAPAELVSLYGPVRSFGRKDGEVVSAISIPVKFTGLCKGAKSDNSLILSLTSVFIIVVLLNLFPP